MKPAIGTEAPILSFSAIGRDYPEETQLSLHDFKGKKVVCYFYPKNNTPG